MLNNPVIQLTPQLQHISYGKKSQNVDFMHHVDCEGVLHMVVTVQMFWSTSPTCSRSPSEQLWTSHMFLMIQDVWNY